MSFIVRRKASLLIVVALVLIVLLGACRAYGYGWQATAEPPTPSGVDTSITIDDITPTPTPPRHYQEGDGHEPPPGNKGVDLVAVGKALVEANGCIGCHSIDGSSGVGPTWQGLFGSTETLADGSTAQVNEAYLRVSIVNPNAQVVAGFSANIMPVSYDRMSEDELRGIIEYIKTFQ